MADKSVLLMPGEVTGAQAQMMRNALGSRRSGGGTRRKRRGKKRTAAATPRRSKRMRRKSGSRSRSRATGALVKGSAAAKRRMAQLRAMRRK